MRTYLVLILALVVCLLCKISYGIAASAERARVIFEQNCTVCHGGPSPQLFTILNVRELEEKGVVQGKAESKLYKAITRAERQMPLGRPQLSLDDKQSLLTWLTEGYPPLVEEPPPPPRDVLDYNDEARCVATDLLKVNEFVARDYRYAVLANYYNGALKGNIDRLAEAVSKLLNSVSLADVYPLVPVECRGNKLAILRIDLRKLNQTGERWDQILVDGNYRYFYDRRGVQGFEEAVFYEREIERLTRAKTVAFVRADWLVETASKDPVYSNLLFKDVKVKTIDDLERKFLRVDTFRQLFQTFEARQAIFRRSGVTLDNRLLQRFELDLTNATGFTYRSALWKTFDTKDNKDKRNLLAFPFGPFYSFYQLELVGFLLNRAFEFDATEVIFSTPGGLAFSLFDGKGNRIEEADTQVAFHQANSVHPIIGISKKAGTITNGVSCYACHSGMNLFHDEGRKHINASTDFTNEQVDFANRILYHSQDEVDLHVRQTNQAYAVSQKNLGAKQVTYVDTQEPIFATAKWYNEDVGVCQFGAELGLTCDEAKVRLTHAPELARLLGLSETLSGKASRVNIERLQRQIAKDLNLGVAVEFKNVDPPPPPCVLSIRNRTHYPQWLQQVTFPGHIYAQEHLSPGEVRRYKHNDPARLDLCMYYRPDACVQEKNVSLRKCRAYEILTGQNGYGYLHEVP